MRNVEAQIVCYYDVDINKFFEFAAVADMY
jgi:hypothetical protein